MEIVKVRLRKNGRVKKVDELRAAVMVESGEAEYVGRSETASLDTPEKAVKKRARPRKRK